VTPSILSEHLALIVRVSACALKPVKANNSAMVSIAAKRGIDMHFLNKCLSAVTQQMACLFCANDAEEQLNKSLCIVCVENDLCGVFIAQMLVVEIVNLHSA
jgi:hypothetical protein